MKSGRKTSRQNRESASLPAAKPSQVLDRKPLLQPRLGVLVGVAIILISALATRFVSLGFQGYHHDESIHALHSWKIVHDESFRYRYDPVYHGPFLYHFGALFHALGFPDNDAFGRFPYALLGVGLVGMWLLLGKRLGWGTVFLVSGLLVLSPIVNYFSRFARNDVYMSAWLTGMIVFGALYCWSRKVRWLTPAALFMTLSYCTKENSYINNFGVCGFLVVWGGVIVMMERRTGLRRVFVDYLPLARLLAIVACFAVSVFTYVAIDSRVGPETGLVQGVSRILRHSTSIAEKMDASAFQNESGYFTSRGREEVRRTYYLIAFAASVILLSAIESLSHLLRGGGRLRWAALSAASAAVYLLLAYRLAGLPVWLAGLEQSTFFTSLAYRLVQDLLLLIAVGSIGPLAVAAVLPRPEGERFGELREVKDYLFGLWGFFLTLLLSLLIFLTLFTSLGENLSRGPHDGVYSYIAYWFKHQTGDYRIWGPWWYYLPRLFLFETLSLLLLAWIGVSAGYRRLVRREAPNAAVARPGEPADPAGRDGTLFWRPVPAPLLLLSLWLAGFFILIYAALNEKVPWLGTYQAYMLAVSAGLAASHWLATHPASPGPLSGRLRDVWECLARTPGSESPLRAWAAVCRFASLAVILAGTLFVVGQHLTQVFFRPDYPSELLVYTATTHEFAAQMRRIESLQDENDGKLRIAVQGKSEWPTAWYFRKWKPAFKTVDLSADIVVADDTPENRRRLSMARDRLWEIVPCRLRGWWIWHGVPDALPGKLALLPNLAAFLSNAPNDHYSKFPLDQRPSAEAYSKNFEEQVWDYVFFRRLWYPTAGEPVIVAYKTDQEAPPDALAAALEGAEMAPVVVRPTRFLSPGAAGLSQPRGLDLSSDGRIAVADSRNGRVQILNATGELLATWGEGVLSKEYSGVSDIAWDASGALFVADTWAHTIRKFDPQGNLVASVSKWTLPGKGAGNFFGPRGVAVGPEGRVYVTDTGHKLVRVFNNDLGPILTFGGSGPSPGDFNEPVGVACDAQGRLLVADAGNGRVQRFLPNGQYLDEFPTFAVAEREAVQIEPFLDVLPDGRFAVSYSTSDNIWIVDPVARKVSIQRIGAAGFNLPTGIASDRAGGLWVTSRSTGRIAYILPPD